MLTLRSLYARLCKLENKPEPTVSVTTTTAPVYEYRDVWAEESSGLNANSAEWSFGNGAVGFMGLPIDAGWEVFAIYFHADTYPSTARVQVDLMNYGNVPSAAAANTITSISLANAFDGGGGINNGYKYETLANPVTVPTGVVGFITRGLTGNVSDARVGVRLRRKSFDAVTSVTIV